MSKLLIVNAGSSSMKFKVYEKEGFVSLSEGIVERIGNGGNFVIEFNGEKKEFQKDFANHVEAVATLKEQLLEMKVIESFDEIEGIGHRVVQGGVIFPKSALIEENELAQIKDLSKLAPLHNPGASAVIAAMFKEVPHAKNVAVFDTSFHTTMPAKNYTYAVPEEWREKYHVRRYGAHGTSHRYMAERVEQILNKEKVNIISCHLGNGASLAAIQDSKCINTSMGLTPLAGIVMGTRSGDIDPSILEYVVNESGKSIKEVTNSLNKESGILALSGVSNDFRDIEAAIDSGDQKAITAVEIYAKRVADYIVQYQNDLSNNVDAIVFTAGIGENASYVREAIIDAVHTMNVSLNKEINNTRTKEDNMLISDEKSDIPVYMIKTDEELMIARDLVEMANL